MRAAPIRRSLLGVLTTALLLTGAALAQTTPSQPLNPRVALKVGAIGAVSDAGIFIAQGPVSHYFKLEPLPLTYFAFVAAILLGYMALTQAMKGFYTRRYGWQ